MDSWTCDTSFLAFYFSRYYEAGLLCLREMNVFGYMSNRDEKILLIDFLVVTLAFRHDFLIFGWDNKKKVF